MERATGIQQVSFPTRLLFGTGAIDALAEHLAGQPQRRPLLVTDAGLTRAGVANRVSGVLSRHGLSVAVYDAVRPNPPESDVTEGLRAYRDNSCDAVVGMGGGSCLDVAKGVALLAGGAPGLWVDPADMLAVDPPPAYAVPTTAGTGSEVTASAVFVSRQSKRTVTAPALVPRVAALDPSLTVALPAATTAATGLGALTDCVEAYLCPGFSPYCDGLALEAAHLVAHHLPRVVQNGDALESRAAMQMASAMAGTAAQKGQGLVRALAEPLSAIYGMPHGLACAALLPPVLEFLERGVPAADRDWLMGRMARLAEALGPGQRMPLVSLLRELIGHVGLQEGLRNHLPALDASILPELGEEAYRYGPHQGSLVPAAGADLAQVYRAAF